MVTNNTQMQYIMTEIQVFTHKTSLKCVTPKLMVILSEMFLTRKRGKNRSVSLAIKLTLG